MILDLLISVAVKGNVPKFTWLAARMGYGWFGGEGRLRYGVALLVSCNMIVLVDSADVSLSALFNSAIEAPVRTGMDFCKYVA